MDMHTRSRPASRSSAGRDRSGRRKRKSRRRLRRRVFAAACAFALALVCVLLLRFHYTHIPGEKKLRSFFDGGTYYNGIIINGKNVSGMTLAEARNVITPILEKQAGEISISVSFGTNLWLFTAADMKVSTDLECVLAEAMLYGRGGTAAENKKAMAELEEGGKEFPVTFTPDDGALSERIERIAGAVDTPAAEPFAEANEWSDTPGFNYHEGTDGHVLDGAALKESIAQAMSSGDFRKVIRPELTVQHPLRSADWLRENTKLRAVWQTSFGGSSSLKDPKRVGNIQKAATLLNGCCVQAGEEFNFNGFMGPRTEAGGWPLAPAIVNGDSYEMQAGGGICQVSTTLYNALLCCGENVEITERYHHSWPSSYADIGLDSTVTGTKESGKSLNFINNTGAPMYIFSYCDRENCTMTIYIYGVPLPEGISYKTRGSVVETVDPPETLTVENINWPTGYKEKTKRAHKGYVSEVYLDKYVNGVLEEGSSVLLYTDRYKEKPAEITIGTGDPSLPRPQK